MCAECRQHPHHPACPNAPQPDYIKPCAICGRMFDEELLLYGICADCISSKYTFELGRQFVNKSPRALAQSIFSIRLDGDEGCVDEAARVLLDHFYWSPDYSDYYKEDEIRWHVLVDNCGEWAEYLAGLHKGGEL